MLEGVFADTIYATGWPDERTKIVSALVRFKKEIKPRSLSDRHQAVGWCFGVLQECNLQLFNIKRVKIKNQRASISLEADVFISSQIHITCDEKEYLNHRIEVLLGGEYPAHGWTYYEPKTWGFDSGEIISEIQVFEERRNGI